jgi:hypothetical protein
MNLDGFIKHFESTYIITLSISKYNYLVGRDPFWILPFHRWPSKWWVGPGLEEKSEQTSEIMEMDAIFVFALLR